VYNNDLAIRLHENDINAFNTLYWKYHGAVYANTLKLSRDAVIAEDIVQEVFITLWEKRHTINPEKDIAGWLFVTSYNKSIDQLKRKLRDSLAKEHLEIKTDVEADINNDLTDVRLSTLEKAMQQLSPQKRKVFELCKMQGKTYEKAAQELQISKYTVKEYLSEAVLSIKDYIRQHPEHQYLLAFALAQYLL